VFSDAHFYLQLQPIPQSPCGAWAAAQVRSPAHAPTPAIADGAERKPHDFFEVSKLSAYGYSARTGGWLRQRSPNTGRIAAPVYAFRKGFFFHGAIFPPSPPVNVSILQFKTHNY